MQFPNQCLKANELSIWKAARRRLISPTNKETKRLPNNSAARNFDTKGVQSRRKYEEATNLENR